MELKKNEFQGELEKQREQLDRIQSSHDSQLESVNKIYQDEKARPALLSPQFCSRCRLRQRRVRLSGRMSDRVGTFVMMWHGPLDRAVTH